MRNQFIKLFCISMLLLLNNTMAFSKATNTGTSSNLAIQIGNLSEITQIPKHDFAYAMTIPADETFQGDPLEGPLKYNNRDIFTTFFKFNENNIEVKLKLTDPSIENIIIWEGKIIYDKANNKIEYVPEIINPHYQVSINIIQPDQGRAQFIIAATVY